MAKTRKKDILHVSLTAVMFIMPNTQISEP